VSTALREAWGESLASASVQSSRKAGQARQPLLHSLLAGQRRAVECVADASAAVEEAGRLVVAALRKGGRFVCLRAGSSGLLAMQDGLELPGALGVAPEKNPFRHPERRALSRRQFGRGRRPR